MKTRQRTLLLLLLASLLVPVTASAYDKGEGPDPLTAPPRPLATTPGSSITLAIDNDLLVPGSRDQDYTYGLNITYAGSVTDDLALPLRDSLGWLDRRSGFALGMESNRQTRKVEFGLFGFTPEDVGAADPVAGDRPYASLVYASSTRESYDREREVSWHSTLTLGLLGLDIVGEVQNIVHDRIGSEQAQGWKHQISAGGEPTARYSLSRQRLLYRGGNGIEMKTTLQGSFGYLTEASWSLSARMGKLQTPWVSFNPELTSYGEKSVPVNGSKIDEQYFWTGIALKARLYNAFLQGQFRDSDLTYDSGEINHGIVEAWIGYTVTLDNGYSLTYSVRGHTSELKRGPGDRNVVWGGLQLSRNFS